MTITKDGNLDEVSVLPDSVDRGDHLLHVVGVTSGRSARAKFTVVSMVPKIAVDTYSVKSNHTFGFSGTGFALASWLRCGIGGLGGSPLATFLCGDAQGNVRGRMFRCRSCRPATTPCISWASSRRIRYSVGLSVQGFSPWVVLDSYSLAPYAVIGFRGQDFVPAIP